MDWKSTGMKIFLNFSNPELVSSGTQFDVISMQVLNGSNFTSLKGSVPMIEYLDGFNQTSIQP
jgi:hypothetical protein